MTCKTCGTTASYAQTLAEVQTWRPSDQLEWAKHVLWDLAKKADPAYRDAIADHLNEIDNGLWQVTEPTE